MSPCSRRWTLQSAALLCTTALAGCASEAPGDSKAYYVYGHAVNGTPGDATAISASDDRIDDVEAIQQAVGEAELEKGASLYVNETTYERVNAALSQTPLYRDEADTYTNRTGLYVNASGKTVRISIVEARLV